MSRFYFPVAWVIIAASFSWGADFSGQYTGQKLSAQIQGDSGVYSGTLILGDKQFPLKAKEQNGKLDGNFSSQGNDFAFSATLDGDHLTLTTGGATYQLDRPTAPLNPLAAGHSPDAPSAVDGAPAGYTILATAPGGKAMFANKPDAANADAALRAAFTDLEHLFDARPTISGAFTDTRDAHSGGAFFTAKIAGRDIKGSIFCGVGEKGAAVSVVYDRKDAPADEWNKLISALPTKTKTEVHKFPDGTGSVELPEGWKTVNQSVVGGVRIEGPAGQVVTLGQGAEVLAPDSKLIQIHDQLAMQAQQMGGPPPPPISMLIAPYSGPVDAVKALMPQIDQFSRQAGGPGVKLDKIIESTDATASLPNGKAALIYSAWTRSEKALDTPYRSLSQVETYVVGEGTWGIFFTELSSPDKTFDRDIVTMRQIASSFKVNDQAVAQVTQNIIAANNQRFAALQEANKERNDSFERLEQSWRDRETVTSRSNADFDEVIRGYRTVEDTSTGDRTSVDLGNVDQVVDKLNQYDPGRYKQIPLRDEMYPLPGH